ncbi:hybrid sensor histidine kinase/response regulator [Methylomagnum ishizawai]|uniref:hybrid sensor histidine kinase/response regulator n=1 Tax=Methylomagnum ishizawai TaxID=1760988 RepID=UPI001C32D8AF|nr:hybrid sensor histidine kinase/response regulator [Methylomagnum ishizawai]BBL75542.1 hybrid sensor histidine kinase/response regulator [Methylomagnum ishizawai]
MSAPDAFLLELFREEMAAHTAALTEGLLTLERGADATTEPLMRAAHSIKGAARVVDLLPAERIAHHMEDVFVALEERRLTLDAAAIDTLLQAVDWLLGLSLVDGGELPDWLDHHADAAEAWAGRIAALLDPPGIPAPPPDPDPPQAAANVPPETEAPPAAAPIEPTPPAQPPSDGTAPDRAVKVTADTLSQLLGYAAEALLEAQRLEPLVRAGQNLKKLSQRLAGALDSDPASAKHLLRELDNALDRQDAALREISSRGIHLAEQLHRTVLSSRMRPFADGVQGFPRLVRDLARQLGKQARLDLAGLATRVDRDVLDKLDAPLNHLLRNALDHGLESPEEREAQGKPAEGRIVLEARHRAGRLVVSVRDDGRGVDLGQLRARIVERGLVTQDMAARLSPAELYDFLFLPGLSTRDSVTEISGRGVGLDVVQTMVHGFGGSLKVGSEPGQGTRFELVLPATRSVSRVLRVDIAGEAFALPLARIDQALRLSSQQLYCLGGYYFFPGAGENIALVSARALLALDEAPLPEGELSLVLIGDGEQRYALEVDALRGECELVARPLDPRLGKVPNLGAAAVDEQGVPVLILDVDDLLRSAERLAGQAQRPRRHGTRTQPRRTRRVLVVDDSLTVRELERKLLENRGYEVEVAVDGMEGWNALGLADYDLVVSDVDMPRMNGIDLVRKIKSHPRFAALPVVIVSYKDRPEDRLRGMEAGADYYLTKGSFHDSGLIDAVHDLIGAADAP